MNIKHVLIATMLFAVSFIQAQNIQFAHRLSGSSPANVQVKFAFKGTENDIIVGGNFTYAFYPDLLLNANVLGSTKVISSNGGFGSLTQNFIARYDSNGRLLAYMRLFVTNSFNNDMVSLAVDPISKKMITGIRAPSVPATRHYIIPTTFTGFNTADNNPLLNINFDNFNEASTDLKFDNVGNLYFLAPKRFAKVNASVFNAYAGFAQSITFAFNRTHNFDITARKLELNSTNTAVYIFGDFKGNNVDMDLSGTASNLTTLTSFNATNEDMFIGSYSTANGTPIKVSKIGGAGQELAVDFKITSIAGVERAVLVGNLVSGFATQSNLSIDNLDATSTVSGVGGNDILVGFYDLISTTSMVGVNQFLLGNTANDNATSIAIDKSVDFNNFGKVHFGGTFTNSIDFDPSANTVIKSTQTTTSVGYFLASYNMNGDYQNTNTILLPASVSYSLVAMANKPAVSIFGTSNGVLSFGGNNFTVATKANNASYDGFMAQYNSCQTPVSSHNAALYESTGLDACYGFANVITANNNTNSSLIWDIIRFDNNGVQTITTATGNTLNSPVRANDQSHSYYYTITNSGCGAPFYFAKKLRTLTQYPIINSLSFPASVCGNNANYNPTFSAFANQGAVKWYKNGVYLSATDGNFSPNINNGTIGGIVNTYYIEIVNSPACSITSANFNVSVVGIPHIELPTSQTVCIGVRNTIIGISTTLGSTFRWNNVASPAIYTFTGINGGINYTFEVRANGCTSTKTIQTTGIAPPTGGVITANIPSTCVGFVPMINFNVNSNVLTAQWVINNTVVTSTGNGAITLPTSAYNALVAEEGVYSSYLNLINSGCSVQTPMRTFTIVGLPTVSGFFVSTFCGGGDFPAFNTLIVSVSGAVSAFNSNQNPTFALLKNNITTGFTGFSQTNGSFRKNNSTLTDNGEYAIRLSDATGCRAVTNNLTASGFTPPPTAAITGTYTNLCPFQVITITTNIGLSNTPITYQWFKRPVNTAFSVPGANLPTLEVDVINPILTASDYYSIKVTNTCGSLTSAEKNFTAQRVLRPTITVDNNTGDFTITNNSSFMFSNWYNENAPLVSLKSTSSQMFTGYTATEPGTYFVTAIALSGNTCVVPSLPLAFAPAQTQTITGFPVLQSSYEFPQSSISFENVTATSGLQVSVSSSNPSVISINGTNLVFNNVGTATVTASQNGNMTFNTATPISYTINVTLQAVVTGAMADVELATAVNKGLIMSILGSGFANGASVTVGGIVLNNVSVNGNVITGFIPTGSTVLNPTSPIIIVQNVSSNPSVAVSPVVVVINSTSINSSFIINNLPLTIFPNPSTGTFTVKGGKSVTVFDLLGKVILSTSETTFTISSKGIFIAQVETESGIKFVKLVVE